MARAASDGEAYFALATKGGFRADSGPSRSDTCRLTFRPMEASKAVVCYVGLDRMRLQSRM
jgi:hypothetical protein